MIAALTFIGWWCIASAICGAGISIKFSGSSVVFGIDLLFGLAGIGVLFLLLSRMGA